MKHLYPVNNLPFYNAHELLERSFITQTLTLTMQRALQSRNRAWFVEQMESPMLIERARLSAQYTSEDIFILPKSYASIAFDFVLWFQALTPETQQLELLQWKDSAPTPERAELLMREFCPLVLSIKEDHEAQRVLMFEWCLEDFARRQNREPRELALRPETTPATYAWMTDRMQHDALKLPYCCWQLNKSFRREQDQPTKHVRLKEFYQQEFQCAYAANSHDDYQEYLVPILAQAFFNLTHCPIRIVASERLPSYSVCTIDIECFNSQKWMELASISKRTDFTPPAPYDKTPTLVVEMATSPDRIAYCNSLWQEACTQMPPKVFEDEAWRQALVPNAKVFSTVST